MIADQPHRPRLISIHALRKESDTSTMAMPHRISDFNPRSP